MNPGKIPGFIVFILIQMFSLDLFLLAIAQIYYVKRLAKCQPLTLTPLFIFPLFISSHTLSIPRAAFQNIFQW